MKKFFSVLLTLSIMFMWFITLSVAPAQANQPGTISICHANNGVKEFTQDTVSKNAITNKGHSSHEGDIIPPFNYTVADRESTRTVYFPGLNWNSNGSSEAFVNNGCKTPLIPIQAVRPTFEPATCLNLVGRVVLSAQPEGIKTEGVSAIREGDKWRVTYTVTDASKYGMVPNNQAVFFVDINKIPVTDPLWNAEANACNLPDTGIGTGATVSLLVVGGLVILGGVALLIFRRKVEDV